MFNDINHLHYKAESAEKLNEVIHDKYTSCLKDRLIGREIQELQDITNLSNSKAKESEQGMLNEEDEIQIAKNSKKKFAKKALTQLGKAVWDNMFEENNPELPSTRFMRRSSRP